MFARDIKPGDVILNGWTVASVRHESNALAHLVIAVTFVGGDSQEFKAGDLV